MAKKTRHQKIRADLHRSQNTVTFQYTATPTAQVISSGNQSEFKLIKKDIYKTLFWAVVFIAFECMLYIFTRRFGW